MRGVFVILSVVACAYGGSLPLLKPSVLVQKPIQPPPRVVVINRKIPTNSKIDSIEQVIPLNPQTITVERTVAVPLPPKVITVHKDIIVSHPVLVDKPVLMPPKIITVERRIPIPTPVIVERPVPVPSPVIIQRDVPVPIYRPQLHPVAKQVKVLPPLKLRNEILAATLNKNIVGAQTVVESANPLPPKSWLNNKWNKLPLKKLGPLNVLPLNIAPLKLGSDKLVSVKLGPGKLAPVNLAPVLL